MVFCQIRLLCCMDISNYFGDLFKVVTQHKIISILMQWVTTPDL